MDEMREINTASPFVFEFYPNYSHLQITEALLLLQVKIN